MTNGRDHEPGGERGLAGEVGGARLVGRIAGETVGAGLVGRHVGETVRSTAEGFRQRLETGCCSGDVVSSSTEPLYSMLGSQRAESLRPP